MRTPFWPMSSRDLRGVQSVIVAVFIGGIEALGLRSESSYRFERGCDIGIFFCWGVKFGLAEENDCTGNAVGISIGHRDTDNLVRKNRVSGSTTTGLLFRPERGASFCGHRNRIEENVFTDNGGEGAAAPEAPAARQGIAPVGKGEGLLDQLLDEDDGGAALPQLCGGGQPELKLANPISSELSDMRPSLLPNLIAAAGRNMDRGFADMMLSEVGHAYAGDQPKDETLRAAGIRRGAFVGRNVLCSGSAVCWRCARWPANSPRWRSWSGCTR